MINNLRILLVMQLSALSFTPNLLQSKPVDTKVALVTPSQADSFTPSAKIRQGGSRDAVERSAEQLVAPIFGVFDRLRQHLTAVMSQNILPKAEKASSSVETQVETDLGRTTQALALYHNLMGEGDEKF
jgi:hypothetical protein